MLTGVDCPQNPVSGGLGEVKALVVHLRAFYHQIDNKQRNHIYTQFLLDILCTLAVGIHEAGSYETSFVCEKGPIIVDNVPKLRLS